MNARLVTQEGTDKGQTALPAELFGQQVHEHLLWLAVKRHLGNQRQGNAQVKNRAAVSGGGKKPFRQKGTGRARQGSNTSPLMPGGGRAFGPRTREYRTQLPRAQRRAALTSALSHKASENAVTVLESLALEAPATKRVASLLAKIGLGDKRTLLVLDQADANVVRSCRNIAGLRTTLAHQLNPYDLVVSDALLVTSQGLERMKEVYVR